MAIGDRDSGGSELVSSQPVTDSGFDTSFVAQQGVATSDATPLDGPALSGSSGSQGAASPQGGDGGISPLVLSPPAEGMGATPTGAPGLARATGSANAPPVGGAPTAHGTSAAPQTTATSGSTMGVGVGSSGLAAAPAATGGSATSSQPATGNQPVVATPPPATAVAGSTTTQLGAVWNGPYARAAALPAVAATQTAANAGNAQLTTSQAASSDPTWVVDWNSGLTLSPNANDYVQDSASMDLRAQTQGATGATYSWNFSAARAQATSAALPATGCSSPGTSPTGTTSPILCNSQSIAPAASRC